MAIDREGRSEVCERESERENVNVYGRWREIAREGDNDARTEREKNKEDKRKKK